jgi:hypothetical protein
MSQIPQVVWLNSHLSRSVALLLVSTSWLGCYAAAINASTPPIGLALTARGPIDFRVGTLAVHVSNLVYRRTAEEGQANGGRLLLTLLIENPSPQPQDFEYANIAFRQRDGSLVGPAEIDPLEPPTLAPKSTIVVRYAFADVSFEATRDLTLIVSGRDATTFTCQR